jgi:1,4-dihydroxy-2-naphthoate polyprenyltransferase
MTAPPRTLFAHTLAMIQLGRPLFLAGGVIFHALGITMALYTGHRLNVLAVILGQVAITAAQLMTHYSNDYFDLEHDRTNHNLTPWSGGSRVLPDGRLPPRAALMAALVCMGIALAAVALIAVVVRPAPLAVLVLIAGLALAWFYSAPPLRLVGRGLGEITVAIVVPFLTTLAGLTLQGGRLSLSLLLDILPLACFQFAMLLAVEFPDAESDAATHKRTLVVRLGGERAALLHTLMIVAGCLSLLAGPIAVSVRADFRLALALLAVWLIALPVALWQGSRVSRGAWADPLEWAAVAFWGIALLVGTGALEAAAFGLAALQQGAFVG